MYENVFMYSIILLIGVFIGAVSQVILKKAAMQEYDSKIKEYLNVRVIFAYILFFGTTFTAIYAYKGIPLSLGAVMEAASYLFVALFDVVIFKTKINRRRICALLLIVGGIAVYAAFG